MGASAGFAGVRVLGPWTAATGSPHILSETISRAEAHRGLPWSFVCRRRFDGTWQGWPDWSHV